MRKMAVLLAVLLVVSLISCFITLQRQHADTRVIIGLQAEIKKLKLVEEINQRNWDMLIKEERKLLQKLRYAKPDKMDVLEELKRQNEAQWGKSGLRDFENLAEIYKFLAEDDTETHEWIESEFMCADFTRVLMRRAAEKGYRMYITSIFSPWGAHMMNMAFFKVEWEGKIYEIACAIEPQTDEVVPLARVSDAEYWKDSDKIKDLLRLKDD